MPLPKKSVQDMYDWYPCYDINLAFEDPNFRGDAVEVLNYENCPIVDRFWVMARPEMVPDESIMHQFGLDLMTQVEPSSSMALNIIAKANWLAGSITDADMEAAQASEQLVLDALTLENQEIHAEHGRQALAGNMDDSAVLAHDILLNTQDAGVQVLDLDPRTASYKALVRLIKIDENLSEWARLHMISLLEA